MLSRRTLYRSSLIVAAFGAADSRIGARTSPLGGTIRISSDVLPRSQRQSPLPGSGKKFLFIDDHTIEAIDNLARRLHQPRKFANKIG